MLRVHRATTTLEWVVVALIALGVLGSAIWAVAGATAQKYGQLRDAVAGSGGG